MQYLVDASVYIFRAYFSIPDSMRGPDGGPVNALYGYARFLGELMQRTAPEEIAVAFDESLTTSFRNEIYPLYKANRELPPPELEDQLQRCRLVTEALGITTLASPVWEADDIIGTLVTRAQASGKPSTIVSSDKDLAQLVGERDRLWDWSNDRVLDRDGVFEYFGVWPEQVADLLALAGDPVDNIPGVRGIGRKTASALLAHFGSLDELYRRVDEVEFLRIRGAKSVATKLKGGRIEAELSKRLTEIVRDADLGEVDLRWRGIDRDAVIALCDGAGFGAGLRKQLLALDT